VKAGVSGSNGGVAAAAAVGGRKRLVRVSVWHSAYGHWAAGAVLTEAAGQISPR
jgi:hypothetical protein